MYTYKSIKVKSEATFRDRGSKFIAYAFPLSDREDLKEILAKLKKDNPKAVHFCYAYILDADGYIQRASDDGEPSGSAGKPILNQIISLGLTNICVIVVRYFGGTLLGVSGLINAYKSATIEALQNAEIIELCIKEQYKIEFDYTQVGDVMRIIKKVNASIIKQDMGLYCDYTIEVPKSEIDILRENINDYNVINNPIKITKL